MVADHGYFEGEQIRACDEASITTFVPKRLTSGSKAKVGLFSLLPAVVDAVDVPVVATGGIADVRGVAAAFLLGATGVQMGTGSRRAPEAKISPAWVDAIDSATPEGSVATRAFSERLGRSIRTAYAIAANSKDAPEPTPDPIQRHLTQTM